MTSSLKKRIICSIFDSLSSQSSAAILSIDSSEVILKNSRFYQINSIISPGCFLVKNGKFKLTSCYFFFCHTKGGNQCFGKITYAQNSNITMHLFSAVMCGPSVTKLGDSVNVFESTSNTIESYTTSYCYGTDFFIQIIHIKTMLNV